jgi:hypothetical protein
MIRCELDGLERMENCSWPVAWYYSGKTKENHKYLGKVIRLQLRYEPGNTQVSACFVQIRHRCLFFQDAVPISAFPILVFLLIAWYHFSGNYIKYFSFLRSRAMKLLSLDQLCNLLKYAVSRMKTHSGVSVMVLFFSCHMSVLFMSPYLY